MIYRSYEDKRIRELYDLIEISDVKKFRAKFDNQILREKFHTLRELQFGAYHRSKGFDLRYELEIDGKTPDWSLVSEDGNVIEVLDVITLHQRYEKEQEIHTAIKTTSSWEGWITIPPEHIFRKLSNKSGQYSALAKANAIPYTIAPFAAFETAINENDMRHILCSLQGGWFSHYPEVSGIVLFREAIFENVYSYFANPSSEHVSNICAKYCE